MLFSIRVGLSELDVSRVSGLSMGRVGLGLVGSQNYASYRSDGLGRVQCQKYLMNMQHIMQEIRRL